MNLFEIGNELQEAMLKAIDEETGEIVDEVAYEELNKLYEVADTKIENTALFIKNKRAEAEAIKVEKMNMAKRQAQAEKVADWLEKYLAAFLNGEPFSSPRCSIKFRKSVTCEVDSVDALPEIYKKVTYTADKTEIKKALQGGAEVTGARLVEHNNI